MITTRSLSKWFGPVAAVDAIDLDVPAGSVVGFLGPNGAGKSTTLRMLAGYLPPTAGRAEIAGYDVSSQSREVRRRIGYLPESTPLYPEMRVIEYLRFRARLFGVRSGARKSAIDAVLRRCWLTDVRRKPIGHLSKGYRQRVGLAAAMLHNPPVLLLDEPTSGLDPSQIREMRGLIRELAGDHTVFLSTHILPEVELTCDRVVMIAAGRVCAEGTIEDLRQQAADKPVYVVETDASNAVAALRAIPGVAEVRARRLDDGWTRATIRAESPKRDLREAISGHVTKDGGSIRELTRETPSLEQLFIRLISGEASPRPRPTETMPIPGRGAV